MRMRLSATVHAIIQPSAASCLVGRPAFPLIAFLFISVNRCIAWGCCCAGQRVSNDWLGEQAGKAYRLRACTNA